MIQMVVRFLADYLDFCIKVNLAKKNLCFVLVKLVLILSFKLKFWFLLWIIVISTYWFSVALFVEKSQILNLKDIFEK